MIDITQNYFQLFGLPECFDLDPEELRDRFQQLQADYHPDRFARASDRDKRASMQIAGVINQAYETLNDEQTRARYLLQLVDVEFDEEKDTTHDLDFLQAQMALREQIAELEVDEESIEKLDDFSEQANRQKLELTKQFQRELQSGNLEAAKEIVLKLQFFKRLQQQITSKHEQLEELTI